MKKCLYLFICLFTPLFGDESINDVTGKDTQSYHYMSEFINMLATLAFVLILIFASIWFLKKIMRSRMKTLNRSNGIKILERRPLNPKASIYLIDILGKGIVISESQAGIHVITEFPDNCKVEELLEQFQEEKKPRPTLRQILAERLGKTRDAR